MLIFLIFIVNVRPFFIIDWFTDPLTLFFGKMKKKLKMFFILSYPKIYSANGSEYIKNKNSALIPQYTCKFL